MSWIVKRDPFNEMRNLQESFNQAFNTAFPGSFLGRFEDGLLSGKWTPSVDIYEDQNAIKLEADLPGVKPGDFKLSIENYKLTLSGERKFEQENRGDNWHRVERSYGSFTRTFTLPSTVNVDEVRAEFKDGVLTITLPKREEVKAREIQVAVKSEGQQAKAVGASQ
jgi:HSP20 family protein